MADALTIRAHALICSATTNAFSIDMNLALAKAGLSDLEQAQILRHSKRNEIIDLIKDWNTVVASLPNSSRPRHMDLRLYAGRNVPTPPPLNVARIEERVEATRFTSFFDLENGKAAQSDDISSSKKTRSKQSKKPCLTHMLGKCRKDNCPDDHRVGRDNMSSAEREFLTSFMEGRQMDLKKLK